jgi:hypothetical protein
LFFRPDGADIVIENLRIGTVAKLGPLRSPRPAGPVSSTVGFPASARTARIASAALT